MFDVVVIVLNYNTKKMTAACVRSLLAASPKKHNAQVVIVDNKSNDGSVEHLKKDFGKEIEVISNNKNLGFAAGNNVGIRKYLSKTKSFLILNSDTIAAKNLFSALKDEKLSKFDILSLKLINPDGTLQPTGGDLPKPLPLLAWLTGLDDVARLFFKLPSYQRRDKAFFRGTRSTGWVGATAMFVKRLVFKKIGLFDEKLFMYGEDVEFCMRASRAGFKIGWSNVTKVVHHGGGSLDMPMYRQWLGEFRGLLYIYKKYYGVPASVMLKFLIYPFVFLRTVAFFVLGRRESAQAYAKILTNL